MLNGIIFFEANSIFSKNAEEMNNGEIMILIMGAIILLAFIILVINTRYPTLFQKRSTEFDITYTPKEERKESSKNDPRG